MNRPTVLTGLQPRSSAPQHWGSLDVSALRRVFDATEAFTVGIEEEVLLVDPRTHELAPIAAELVGLIECGGRITTELPAAQLELVTSPHRGVDSAMAELRELRA